MSVDELPTDLCVRAFESLPRTYEELGSVARLIEKNTQLREDYHEILRELAQRVWKGIRGLQGEIPEEGRTEYLSGVLQKLSVYEHQLRSIGGALRIELGPVEKIREELEKMQKGEEKKITPILVYETPQPKRLWERWALQV